LGLASAGAAVAIAGRDVEKAAEVVAEIKAMGVEAFVVAVDVTKREMLAGAIAQAEAELGPLDILVNNAGNADVSGGILNQSEEGWDRTVATHLDATFLLSRLAAQSMQKRGGGKIINLGSIYSFFGAGALPAYGAVKGAIIQLTKAMAVELAVHNIQVNAIAPGWIETDMTHIVQADPDWSGFNAMLMARTPAGRWGQADEIAGAAVFLASPAAQFITGATLCVDGGYSAF
jgi:2-deoxy-D-gluconate 3-dehydrogenase